MIKKRLSRIFLCLAAFLCISFLLQFLLQFLAIRILNLNFGKAMGNYALLFSAVPMYLAAFPLTVWRLRKIPAKPSSLTESKKPRSEKMLPFGNLFQLFCMSCVLMTVGNLIGNGLMHVISYETPNLVEELVSNTSSWVLFFSTVLLAPFVEEILLRKMLIDRVLFLGERTAVFLSAFCFGLMHGNLFQFFYAFSLGMLFAVVYIRTQNIRNTICLHMLVNFCGGLLPQSLMKLTANSAMTFVFALYGAAGLLVLLIGIYYFYRNRTWLCIHGGDLFRPGSAAWLKCLFLTPGMVLFLLTCILLFVMN